MKDRRIRILLGIYAFTSFALLFGLAKGSLVLSFQEVIHAIFYTDNVLHHNIIFNVRLPRNLIAAMVGMNLALSGVTLQGIMRNPMADPGIIGISSGAGLAAFLVMILFPDYAYLVPFGAFGGALLTTMLIYSLAWKNGVSPVRLILAGMAVSALLGAAINFLMTFYPDRVAGTMSFMVGGLSGRTWPDFRLIWPYSLIMGCGCILMSHQMNALLLGDEVATGLGIAVERTRWVFIVLASFLAASAVSVAGLLGFVGLIIPHIARILIGSDYRFLYPATIGLGAGIMILCDCIARLLFDPVELPVGIIMALLGAPFFLYLIRERKEVG